jgi:exodeoxyribonuclease VII small subunit
MGRTAKKPLQFEAAMQELEQLVDSLEQGELSLEQSLQAFERGVELARTCQQALRDAEQKIEILTAPTTEAETTPLPNDD